MGRFRRGFSLFEETDKWEMFIKNLAPISSDVHGFTAETPLKGDKVREYILYFPPDLGFSKMAEKIYKKMIAIDKKYRN